MYMKFMKFISVPLFITSLAIGLFVVYISMPANSNHLCLS